MERRPLGSKSGATVSAVGLGLMGMSEFYGAADDSQSLRTMEAALAHGIDFMDTADLYGRGANEELFGRFLAGKHDRVVVATKFGIRRDPNSEDRKIDNSPAYVMEACEASLKRLGVDCIDLYYCHRRNPEMPIADMVGAMARLVQQGKVRWLGLSEVSPATLEAAHAVHPIAAVQSEYSLWSREPEHGILGTCRRLGVAFVAYAPLGRGFLTGQLNLGADDARGTMPRFAEEARGNNERLVANLTTFAGERGRTAAQIALGWILSKHEQVIPIFGARRPERIPENAAATNIRMSTEDVAYLDKLFSPEAIFGSRYPEAAMRWLESSAG
jgi:aryl-alcohol dehydrogenase-like predicted oxidoreductase